MRSPSHAMKLCVAIAWKSSHAMNSTVAMPSAIFTQRKNLLVYWVINGVKLRTAVVARCENCSAARSSSWRATVRTSAMISCVSWRE